MNSRASVLSLTDPYASNHGGTIRTRALVRSLEISGFDTAVLTPSMPLPSSSQSGSVGLESEELRPYARLGRFAGTVSSLKKRFLPMPTEAGARSAHLRNQVLNRSADLILVSIIAHRQYAELVPNVIWQDYMDLWGHFGKREARNRRGLPRLTAEAQARTLERREICAARDANIVTVTGWKDWDFLARYSDAHWLPTPLPDDSFCTVDRVQDADKVAGFIGNFEYWPNRDAYRMLVDYWLPALRSKGWRIIVAGHHTELLGTPPDGVTLIGSVPDVDDFYRQVSLSLAPIRLGGGMKVKVLESLAKGVPVAGTSEALEGFSPDVKRLCIEWGDDVNLDHLNGVHEIDPTTPALDPYRQSSFERTVKEILNGKFN